MPEYPRADLVVAAEPDRHRLDAYCRTFGIEGVTDYDAVIDRDDIDIVHIASPVCDIPDLTMRAARAGKHVVMGKPMAMTVAQADEMVAVVEASGVVCVPFQGLMRLRHQSLKTRLDAGEIGDLAVLHQTGRWAIAEDWYQSGTPGWFVDPAKVPGGAFIDEGIYWIDLFRWLAGSEVIEVDARMRNIVHLDIAGRGLGVCDVHVRQRDHRHAGGVLDDQRAAQDRAVAEAQQCRPTRDGRDAGRVDGAVVPIAGRRRARGRGRGLGVRAARRGVRPTVALPAEPPRGLHRHRAHAAGDGARCP